MRLSLLLLLGALSGCASTTQVVDQAAAIADDAVRLQVGGICRVNSIGSTIRAFGYKKELWGAVCVICREKYPGLWQGVALCDDQ